MHHCRNRSISAAQRGTLVRLIKRVFDKVALKYEKVTEGVGQIMSGYIIRTDIDDIYEQGEAEGIRKGQIEGRAEGRIVEYIAIRREDGYTDERIRDEIMNRFQLSEEEAKKYLEPEPELTTA